jgi:kumamolisin
LQLANEEQLCGQLLLGFGTIPALTIHKQRMIVMKTKLVSLDKCEKSTTYRKHPVYISLAMLLLLACCVAGNAQSAPDLSSPARGTIVIPSSSLVPPGEGFRAHTNIENFIPAGQGLNPAGQPNGETPASIACIYQLVLGPYPAGCQKFGPNAATALPAGGSGVIAIVDACDAPKIEQDLNTFYKQFYQPQGYALPKFKKIQVGTPCNDTGWAEEETLDVEWAYAMAPNATIVLVEATDPTGNSFMAAEDVATKVVANNAASVCPNYYFLPSTCYGQVSNSWGTSEFFGETTYDIHFHWDDVTHCELGICYISFGGPVTYFASAGDKPGVSYPSAAPSVISAGGTTIYRDKDGNFLKEGAWSQTGGGQSAYEPLPSYQGFLAGRLKNRATPDLACVSDPASGVSVYFTDPVYGGQWYVVGGTSVCSPILAGITNSAGNFENESSSFYEHSLLYSEYQGYYHGMFTDVTDGTCGSNYATNGYDLCTGIGSPRTLLGK